MSDLLLVPLSLAEAQRFVADHHRHHKPPQGHKFSVGVIAGESLCGVAIVGRPVARHYDNGRTVEITRTATDGTRNANSMLYGACRRAAFALGYDRIITYTQTGETGASLRGAGYTVVAQRKSRAGWFTPSRPRENQNDRIARTLWEVAGDAPP